jgi:hypothetical protein
MPSEAKKWSYADVTACAEREIERLMSAARVLPADEARTYRQWAYGVYVGWRQLTGGDQDEHDASRLEQMTARSHADHPRKRRKTQG